MNKSTLSNKPPVKATFSICDRHIDTIFSKSKQIRIFKNMATYLELLSQ